MARKNQHTFAKRQRERKKAEKAAEKRARRDARKGAGTEAANDDERDSPSADEASTPDSTSYGAFVIGAATRLFTVEPA